MATMREAAADTFNAVFLPALAPLVVAMVATCPLRSPISFSCNAFVSILLSTAAVNVLNSTRMPLMSSLNSHRMFLRSVLICGSSPRPRSAALSLVSCSRSVVRCSRSRSLGSHMVYTVPQCGRKVKHSTYSGKPLALDEIRGRVEPSRSAIEVPLTTREFLNMIDGRVHTRTAADFTGRKST